MIKKLQNQSGVSIIAAIFIIVILAFMGLVFLTLFTATSSTSINELQSTQALYVAEGGMERAVYQYKNDGTACAALINNNIPLGLGNFTTTGILYNPSPATTLSGAIGAADTIIPVVSTAGYAPNGRIRIDSEDINYSSISGNNFIVSQRGAVGTTAANHLANIPVYQNQCFIQSSGTAGNAIRAVQKAETGKSTNQGSFTKPAGTGNQSITGVGFKPKAVIFFWTRQTVTGFGVGTTSINEGVGFATGAANQRAVSTTANRGGSSDEGRRYSQSYAIIFLNGGGAPSNNGALANLVSMDADGFTLNWSVWGGGTYDANTYRVYYIALAGDITTAMANTFSLQTGAGNQAVNGVGFKPDFVMFLWSTTGAYDSNLARSEIGIGLAQAATAQAALVVAGGDNTGNNADKRWQQRTDSCILLLTTANPPTQDAVASFVSLDADGFTLNKSNAPAANTPIFYLAVKGGKHKVGDFTQAVATGSQTTTGLGFQPEQLILASRNLAATTTVDPLGAISIGAAQSSASRSGIWFQDRSDQDNTANQMNMYNSITDVITLATADSTLKGRADFTSFVSDGFTLNWTTTDATQRQILYWAVGSNTSATMWREVFQ